MRAIERRRAYGSKVLPYDARIEWLESTGEQYIKTGIIPTSEFSFEVTANILGYYEWNPIGTWDGWLKNMFGVDLKFVNNGGMLNCWGDAFTENKKNPINTWLKISQKNGEQKVSRVSDGYVYLNSNLNKTFHCSSDVYIFSLNIKDKSTYSNEGRINSVIIRNNNKTLLDFVPVRKDGIGYMYDKVSGQLFGNQGSGAFIIGPDI